MRHARPLRRTVASLLAAAALLALLAVPASAEPTSSQRRHVAEEVADTVCRTAPGLEKLPDAVDPRHVCRSVIVENVDPDGTNTGVSVACATALPPYATSAVKFCVEIANKLLDPARQLFLDKIVPAVQQVACLATNPAAFDCLAQQVHVWLKQSIVDLWQGLIVVLTTDTRAVEIVDGWRNAGVVSLYSDVGALGASILLGLMLTSLLMSAIRFDFRQFGSTLLGVMVWGLFWSGGAVIAIMLLRASDAAARWMAGVPDAGGQTDLARAGIEFGRWVDYIAGATATGAAVPHPVFDAGSFTGLLICLLLIVAIVVTLVSLLMRNVAVLLLIVLLPITLAGTAGPRMTRDWFVSALRLYVALLLAKPLIVIAIRLGAVLVSVPAKGEPQTTFSDALLGVAIILLAGLLPGVIYRFSGGLIHTSAGAPPRASAGVTGQSAQSAQSSLDMTRMIMERNAPQPMFARPAAGGSATTAGTGGLGAAAGPLAVAAVAGAMAGGALESGGRWMAGQAATAGGVVGDVEGPHVPSPPISRAYPHGQGAAGYRPQSAGAAAAAAGGREATVITITQTHSPGAGHGPAMPPAGPHLVIPGTVVPDRALPEPPEEPPALPRGGGDG